MTDRVQSLSDDAQDRWDPPARHRLDPLTDACECGLNWGHYGKCAPPLPEDYDDRLWDARFAAAERDLASVCDVCHMAALGSLCRRCNPEVA